MAEEKKSRLFALKPLIERWPAVAKPEGHVHFRTKLLWTVLCLILYYILTNVTIFGIQSNVIDLFAQYRFIMAGASGSIMHLGIGPIVTASIILQLFVGAKIINLDLTKKEDKAIYQGTQKILVIVMIVVEAVPQIFGYLKPNTGLVGLVGEPGANLIIILQLVIGALLVFFMDELISKWGIGSGISLFIAAGVSQAIFTGVFNWLPANAGQALSLTNPPAGAIPGTTYLLSQMSLSDIVSWGYQTVFMGSTQIGFQNAIVPLLGTLFIFFIVVYAESSRIELPLAHGRVRGARGRYPIRLIYASNIPVILMSALLANVNMFAMMLYTNPGLQQIPFIGGQWWIGRYDLTVTTQPLMGGAWYLSSPNGLNSWLVPILIGGYSGHAAWQYALKVIIYFSVMIIGSIFFAKFWIETTNMGPTDVAKQIQSSGMQIPGFRRDPRVLRKVLERYIPVVTVIGGAAVGALASFADAIGTVGNASGTGVLLTVGIMIRMYEDIAKEQAMEMHPVLRGFFGNE
jgi:preprotein translocase subunit SecY